ncbi:MAG: hypothetical protein K2Q10_13370, partial [Rhodospirillales bacterium]|nr:hypothetical protein [Rhodospirillales bacterium]
MSSPIVAIFSSAAVAAMTVYSAAVASLYLNQDSLVFHPRPLNPTIEEALNGLAGAHPLEVTAGDGIRLKGWVVKREGESGTPAPLLLYFGGNAEEIGSYLLEASQYLGRWSIAALNYRGYGASQGSPGEQALLSDA